MKKILVTISLIVALTALISSCKTRENCPAYGQLETEQVQIQ